PERNPKRETTVSLYLSAESLPQAREIIEDNTTYNIEFIEELSDKALTYEKANPNFEITTF
ncbi:MAG: RNA polymerase epsilon subunit, partial [Leuconostoc sp.]